MKFKFLATNENAVDIRPNKPTRKRMDETSESFAYRCLPLNIGNSYGWSFHLKEDFVAHWDGGREEEAVTILSNSTNIKRTVSTIFGHGIITFHTHGIFQTEPGWSLYASGPANEPRDAISPISGIIETEWSPYSFTMNWKITRPNTWISFEKGDVFCSVVPIQRGVMESIEPEIWPISVEPDLEDEHKKWSQARKKFNDDLKKPGSDAEQEKWQKSYYRGFRPDGSPGAEDHIIKLRLNPFKKQNS